MEGDTLVNLQIILHFSYFNKLSQMAALVLFFLRILISYEHHVGTGTCLTKSLLLILMIVQIYNLT